jgi:drug/metabolite transporter (DMT)-like permease
VTRPLDLALFALYTACSVVGLIVIKSWLGVARLSVAGGELFAKPVLMAAVGACLYVFSFAIWLAILARNELSSAYPVAIGLTLVFSTVLARVTLGETLSPVRILGIAVVFAGIWLVTRA